MRVTSDLYVSALVRRAFAGGGFAAVSRRGATEAGAIFIVSRGRDGRIDLFGPAPQADYDGARPSDRLFAPLLRGVDDLEMQQRIDREMRFDPDLWLVEVEPGAGADGLFEVREES